MEFYCVLSVGGSLAYYHFQKQGDEIYEAVLRNGTSSRSDIPPKIMFTKNGEQWNAEPWNEEVVPVLLSALNGK